MAPTANATTPYGLVSGDTRSTGSEVACAFSGITRQFPGCALSIRQRGQGAMVQEAVMRPLRHALETFLAPAEIVCGEGVGTAGRHAPAATGNAQSTAGRSPDLKRRNNTAGKAPAVSKPVARALGAPAYITAASTRVQQHVR